jgi:hypothetical protein
MGNTYSDGVHITSLATRIRFERRRNRVAGHPEDLGASGMSVPPIELWPDPQLLRQIMTPLVDCAPIWPDHELRNILRHQLESLLAFDLSRGDPADIAPIRPDTPAAGPSIRTFGDLFRHPQPPLELLIRVKQFAKSARADPDATLPAEIASLLYYAAIAAALVRLGTRITTLTDDVLAEGFRTLVPRDWIDDANRLLLTDAAGLIGVPT